MSTLDELISHCESGDCECDSAYTIADTLRKLQAQLAAAEKRMAGCPFCCPALNADAAHPPKSASGTEASDGKYVCRICNDVGPDLPANRSHAIGGWLCKKCYRETIAVKPASGTNPCLNCGTPWDYKGQCPLCMMTAEELAEKIKPASGREQGQRGGE